MVVLSEDIIKKAKRITIKIAPKHVFGYNDIYEVVVNYLVNCERFNTRYSEKELDNIIHKQAMEGW